MPPSRAGSPVSKAGRRKGGSPSARPKKAADKNAKGSHGASATPPKATLPATALLPKPLTSMDTPEPSGAAPAEVAAQHEEPPAEEEALSVEPSSSVAGPSAEPEAVFADDQAEAPAVAGAAGEASPAVRTKNKIYTERGSDLRQRIMMRGF